MRIPAHALLAVPLLLSSGVCPAADPPTEAKAALQALNEFIGTWKGAGGPDKPRPGPNDPTWSETIQWSWRFRGDDVWLSFEVKDGKYLTGGDVRYLPERKLYRLAAMDRKEKKLEFEGRLDAK